MKSLKVLALVIAGFSAQLKADKIFNSGSTLGINSGVSDTTVNANSVFTATAFDPVNKITYLGETSSTTASAQNLMKSKVASDGTISVTSISGTLTTLQNGVGKTVSKLIVTEDGDLAVLFTNQSNFYVVKNAWSDNPSDWTLVTSPVAKDGNATTTSTKFINLAYAGKNSTGARFVAVIPETATTSLANVTNNYHTMRAYQLNGTTLTEHADTAGVTGLTLNAYAGTFATLAGAFSGTTGTGEIINLSGFHWDSDLKRLYHSLELGSTATSSADHALMFVLYFGEDEGTTGLQRSVFTPISAGLTTPANPLSMRASRAYKVSCAKTLYTSTAGNAYLIAQVQHDNTVLNITTAANRSVYAFPIADDSTALASVRGQAAAVSVTSGVNTYSTTTAASTAAATLNALTTTGDLTSQNAKDIRGLVGGKEIPCEDKNCITHMDVWHDTVIVVCRPSATSNSLSVAENAGVWASSPIYDASGQIAAWTPWTKILGSSINTTESNSANTRSVLSKVYMANDGQLYFVAGNVNHSIVNVTGTIKWGLQHTESNSVFNIGSKSLSTQLQESFSPYPVYTAESYHAGNNPLKNYGIGAGGINVYGSKGKVALVTTTDTVSGAVSSTGMVSTDSFKLFSIPEMGDVLCSEIARHSLGATNHDLTTHGFIFIGGQNGVMVLRKANGNGFDASAAGASFNNMAAAPIADMTWAKIPGIDEPVHKLVSTTAFVYALTSKNVYRIRFHSNRTAFFPNSVNTPATMFMDGMDAELFGPDRDLTNPVEAMTKVVVQKVFAAATNEYLCDIVNLPGSAAIFMSSIIGSGTQLYGFDGDAVSGTAMFNASNIALTGLSFHARKLAIKTPNISNLSLNDGTSNSNYTNAATGLFGAGVNGTIANLCVLSGSNANPMTTLHTYAVLGTLKLDVVTVSSPLLAKPALRTAGALSETSPSYNNPSLANGISFGAGAYIFGDKDADKGMIHQMVYSSTDSATGLYPVSNSELVGGRNVFAAVLSGNGCHNFYGTPFGTTSLE